MDEKKVREAIKEFEIEKQTYEDMISYCKHFEPKNDCERYEEKIAICKTAIEALQKQLLKKPIEIKETYTSKIGAWKMNREILFKAKRKDWRNLPKERWWIEGYYVYCRKRHYILPVLNKAIGFDEREDEWIELDPETICQYTGLCDKNGRKIWENDIVKCRHSQSFGNVKWYCGDYIGWCVDDVYDCEQQFDKDMFDTCEVIGNVFDNPELLEVE